MFGHRDARSDEISADGLTSALAGATPPLVLDVRTPEEYAQGHIPDARLLPLPRLEASVKALPADRRIVCVCRSGNRSGVATKFLRASGLDAQNLVGGMLHWRGATTTGGSR